MPKLTSFSQVILSNRDKDRFREKVRKNRRYKEIKRKISISKLGKRRW